MGYVFTFGADHLHPVTRKSLIKSYIEIPGDIEQSRAVMHFLFDTAWAFQYESPERAGVEKYGLIRIDWPVYVAIETNEDCGCPRYTVRYTSEDGDVRYLVQHDRDCPETLSDIDW